MAQIPEINANDEESATLRILRSSGLKFPVSAAAWKTNESLSEWDGYRVSPVPAGRASGRSENAGSGDAPEHAGKKDDLGFEDLRETQSCDVKRLPPRPVPDTFHCPPPAGAEPHGTLVKISP